MGLGKTLTMISLILSKKAKGKEEDEKKKEIKLEKWISKNGKLQNLFMVLSFFSLFAVHMMRGCKVSCLDISPYG